jgi:very-short-patch-repair endonuclease
VKSRLEELLAIELRSMNVPAFEREYHFWPGRRFRFDFAWPDRRLAVEVDGGTASGGRHTRAGGYERDCEKLNHAACMGWCVLRFTGRMVRSGAAAREIARALEENHT